ncbi:MAG: alpha/beta fold hydrolase [Erythrobacter sp.]
MAESTVKLENEAAQSTSALGPLVGVAREDFVGAVALLLRETASDPKRFMKHAQSLSEDMVKILTGKSELAPHPKDKRFMDPAWQYNPFFKAGAQYYLAVQKGMRSWLEELELDELERNRANFIANIILDGLAPTNTLIGNPTAQKRVIDSGGLSLIKGLQNAYNDVVHNKGMVSQVDKRPFELGKNVAISKGSVVLRTEMMELIHYAPTTDEVHEVPQLTIPPQINKMYINDLSPEKSVVKFQVDNGIQTFVISWRNPSKEQGAWNMTDYVNSCREAMEAVAEITGSKKVNVSAGCSGGQTATMLASKLASDKADLLGTLTLMVCVLHPKATDIEAGSLVSENGMKLARKRAEKAGVIKADDLARGFAWLRPNDLIWNYVINNYLLGADPPAFDVLFWNADATNLSASLMGDFLTVYETLAFTKKGEVEMVDHKVDLSKVKSDLFILGGVTDHITPWKATYRSTELFGSKDVTYVLSQSGHMQAILNPPGNPKAKYFIQKKKGKLAPTADEWLQGTEEVKGSWWPYWMEWVQKRSGKSKTAPKKLGSKKHKPLDAAPGLYVVEEV